MPLDPIVIDDLDRSFQVGRGLVDRQLIVKNCIEDESLSIFLETFERNTLEALDLWVTTVKKDLQKLNALSFCASFLDKIPTASFSDEDSELLLEQLLEQVRTLGEIIRKLKSQ